VSARRRGFLQLAFAAVLVIAGCKSSDAGETTVTIAAAASLRQVMPDLVKRFEAKRPGVKVSVTYGASGDLRKQVEGGAPIDGVLFASRAPVDDLVKKQLVDAGSVHVVAHNRLVLIGPKGAAPVTFATLDTVKDGEKIAIGDPGAVPAGQYAKAALEKLGEWDAVKDKVVFGGDVGAVLQYARRGEVAAAVVYATEARGVDDIVILDTATDAFSPKSEVVAGTVGAAPQAVLAGELLDFIVSPEGSATLVEHGFEP
jgi:molybdate transport system substrate-binding protein